MKRSLGLVITALALLAASPAQAMVKKSRTNGGAITMQQWIVASPSPTGLSGTAKACFKLRGALNDRGGRPRWTDESYATGAPASQCGVWRPVGGIILVPPLANMSPAYTSGYAMHTYAGKRGRIFISFAGVYDFTIAPQVGSGTWVITGGTGAYEDLEGEGTWTADASAFPYVRHTEHGTVWFAADDD